MVLNWRNKVVENFDKKSSCYDQNNILQRTVAGEMMKDLPLLKRADADILEVGCGTGVLTRNLVHKYQGQNLRITDISPQMLEQAKTKIRGNISWTLLDAENDRIKKSYDLIVANMVFQWFEDLEKGILNLVNALKPDGSLFFTVPGPESFKEWRAILRHHNLPSGILNFKEPPGVYRKNNIFMPHQRAWDFLQSVKNMGASCPREGYVPLSSSQMRRACDSFDLQNSGGVTWQILYGHLSRSNYAASHV